MQTRGDSERDDAMHVRPATELTTAVSEERRTDIRTRTLYRTGLLSNGCESGLCQVRNISDMGMMVVSMMNVEIGEALTIRLSDLVSLSGRVIWTSEARVGLQFEESIDCAGVLLLLAAEQQLGAYRAPRLPMNLVGLATTERDTQAVRVRNLSLHGMQISHNSSLDAGMAVKIVLENGLDRRGTVRWANDSRAGLRLAEPIAIEQLALEKGI